MTWSAYIDASNDHLVRQTSRLILVRRRSDGSAEVLCEGGIIRRIQSNEVAPDDVGFTVPSDALSPLLAALSRHLGAVEHPEQLRRDYDAERARVDKLVDSLIARSA